MQYRLTQLFTGLGLFVAAGVALAHPGHYGAVGLGQGLIHPFTGWDHLLAALAVGIWAAQQGGNRLLAMPGMFIGGLLAGVLMAELLPLSSLWIELGVVGSVLLLGTAIALGSRLSASVSLGLVGVFGLMHGGAHGLDLSAAAAPLSYIAGIALSTLVLHLAGIGISLALRQRFEIGLRLMGGTFAITAVAMLPAIH